MGCGWEGTLPADFSRAQITLSTKVVTGLALALLALWPLAALAHAVDQYALPVGREFEDLGPYLLRVALGAIAEAVDWTYAAAGGEGVSQAVRSPPELICRSWVGSRPDG